MKSAINGGLQLSVLDGWWPEAYDDRIGWAIDGTVEADLASQDARHADRLYSLLEDHIAPLYYTRENGLPVGWLQMIRQSMVRCGPRFSAGRMLSTTSAACTLTRRRWRALRTAHHLSPASSSPNASPPNV